jgi:hypothetical protein
MILIIITLIFGISGFFIGGTLGEFFAYAFSILGFISPALYELHQIYKKVCSESESENKSNEEDGYI